MRLSLLLFFSLFIGYSASAQGTVKGQITDETTKETIIGAYILLMSDPSIGAVSDLDGNYSLDLTAGKHKLIYKFTGMVNDTVEVDIADGQTIVLDHQMHSKMLNKVDIVVGKFDQKVEELTFSMEVIKPSLIDNKNTRSIESILDQTPGLNIMDGEPQIRGGSGFTFGVGSKVAVLVDDMPMLSGDAGRPEWGFIPVENIEQIEVVKGASSVLSGASALSGAIHIRTAYPKSKPMTKINVYSGFYSEPEGDSATWWSDYPFIHGMNFLHSRIIKKNFDLVVGGNLNWDHGYIGGPIKGPFVVDTVSEEFTDKQMQHKRARLNFNFRHRNNRIKGLSYGVNGNFMYQKTNMVLAWLDDTSGIFRAYPGAAILQNQLIFYVDPFIEFASKIGVKHSLRMRMMYTDNEMSANQSNQSRVYYADYQFKKEFKFLKDKAFDFIGGVSSQYNDSNAELYKNETSDGTNNLFNLSAYAEVQKNFWKILNLSVGARAEHYRMNDTIKEWNPIFRSGINLKLTQATFLRASYGQGFRFPTITERYISTAVGSFGVYQNPDLLPEKSWNAEVGVNQGFKIKDYMAQLDVAAFLQQYSNTIEYLFGFWDPDPDFIAGEPLAGFKFLNTGDSKVTGFDVTLNGKAEVGKNWEFVHSIGYNYINPITLDPDYVYAEDFNPNNTEGFSFANTSYDTTTNVLKYRFKHTVKADLQLDFYGFSIGYTFKYFSKLENLDQAITAFEVVTQSTGGTLQGIYYIDFFNEKNNGNIVQDLRVSYGFGKDYKHKFAVVVKNIENKTYSLRPLKIEQMRTAVFQYTFKF
ncbi:TonB-dependent receptor [Paracrocinitomix mangrovi]|uniref:TonB-dependent receptor n=1 Tax=Paracrocinitomix mangrovi TaxID=2862509 RepID=UPI001C8CF626|nr:TonB-dependent receptor [Paracrocinitomix mangrovi]UKN01947.1 TonB-dependent receptor [Paracrocinitomix mangrovi]